MSRWRRDGLDSTRRPAPRTNTGRGGQKDPSVEPASGEPGITGRHAPRVRGVAMEPVEMFGGLVQVSRVFIGAPLLMREVDDVYPVIADECRRHGRIACRSYGLPGYPAITTDVVRLILDADLCIFDLSHGSPTVYAELTCAQRCADTPGSLLLLARPGTQLHDGVFRGDVWFYQTIDDLRAIVRAALEWRTEVHRSGPAVAEERNDPAAT